jgi:hypothetical protein
MKKLNILIVMVIVLSFAGNAQQRIRPMSEISWKTYDEAIKLLNKMEKTSFVEQMEGIELDNEKMFTSGREIMLVKERSSINISICEFTRMLKKTVPNHNHTFHDINTVRTELFVHTVKLYEYMVERISENRNVKNIYIKSEDITGGAYICVEFYGL